MAEASARRLAALAALGSKEYFGDTPPEHYEELLPLFEAGER
jgi:hypothetical protein